MLRPFVRDDVTDLQLAHRALEAARLPPPA